MSEPFKGDGVALLQMVYKNEALPLATRMNAASIAAVEARGCPATRP